MQCSAKQPFESECICVTDIKSSWPLLYLYFPYSCTVISQLLTPTEFSTYTEGHAMWFFKCSSMKHLSSACTCSLCLYSFTGWEAWQGGCRIRWHPDHLVKKTQMMTNEHRSEITSPCPSTTDLPSICTSLVHKLAYIYIAKPGRFNLLYKVDQLLSIRSRDHYCVTYLSFQP